MNYLYHMAPQNMKGNYLYPLNQIKEYYPEIYKEAAKKYEGRKKLLSLRIPSLDCLWNDVIHLTAVNPKNVVDELKNAGMPNNKRINWYRIDPNILNPKHTTVYLYKDLPINKRYTQENFTSFNPNSLDKYSQIPPETIDYYKKEYSEGRRPLLFHFVPHILYNGIIDISNSKIVKT